MTAPSSVRLLAWLTDGIAGAGDAADARKALGLAADEEDRVVARTLVREVARGHVDEVHVRRDRRHDGRQSIEAAPAQVADASFLGRLGARSDGREMAVGKLEDLRTLLAVLRAGTLHQRRAAVARLVELLRDPKGLPSDQIRLGVDALRQGRDVELAYERAVAREGLSGSIGREARNERDAWQRIVAQLEIDIVGFWDGDHAEEPLWELPGDQRAQVLMRMRDLPDRVVDHVCAVLEAADGVSDRSRRLATLSSLRFAGDPRLVPSLRAVLDGSEPELAQEAARVLGRIDDPRVRPALLASYERSFVDVHRAVLAGALGAAGDPRGADYVRRLLEGDDVTLLAVTLEAMATVGGPEDGEHVAALCAHDDLRIVAEAVRALARIGDGRALAHLARLRDQTMVSATWAEIEDAELAIRARIELRGEDPEGEGRDRLAHVERAKLATRSDPAVVQLLSLKDLWIGEIWLSLGALERAVARFEAAAARRPGWAAPLVAMALAYARRNKHAQALPAFRRAIEADRARVERNPVAVRAMARSFLRRAEEVERDGRVEIARGLLEEVLTLDLRRAPSALRFELERRRDPLRHRGA